MNIGFTGTQIGMSPLQKQVIVQLLVREGITQAHMGDCIGADKDFYDLVKYYSPKTMTVGHVPEYGGKRAYCDYDLEKEPLPYLVRNKNIVDSSDTMIATPKEKEEQLRSGTWATIRYAKKQGKRLMIIFPDGSYQLHNVIK